MQLNLRPNNLKRPHFHHKLAHEKHNRPILAHRQFYKSHTSKSEQINNDVISDVTYASLLVL